MCNVFSLSLFLSGWAAWHLAHLLEFSHSDALRGATESHSWWVLVWGFCLRRCPAMHLKSSFCVWVCYTSSPSAPRLSLLLRSCFLFITLQSDSNSITHVHTSGVAFEDWLLTLSSSNWACKLSQILFICSLIISSLEGFLEKRLHFSDDSSSSDAANERVQHKANKKMISPLISGCYCL